MSSKLTWVRAWRKCLVLTPPFSGGKRRGLNYVWFPPCLEGTQMAQLSENVPYLDRWIFGKDVKITRVLVGAKHL